MSVFTAVRLHPTEQSKNNWLATGQKTISHGDKEHRFDYVFSGQGNFEVYNASCRSVVEQVVKGYNGTIAAYGQSGSGKTHSLLGTDIEDGILQMAVQNVLELIEQRVSVQYMVKLSAIEVYNENIVDLMDPDATKICRLVDDKVINKREEIIESYEHFTTLCEEAQNRRKVGSTQMNQKSSRSHAVFELVVESCNPDILSGKLMTTVSHLTILDLAGSENTRTMVNAVQCTESKKINLSLLALSRVISMLAEKPKNTIGIPFRDSVLTRMLKKVLGGNSQFLLFCCIRKEACTETASTISFGQKAKKMPNEARKNVATEDGAITALIAQIGDLKRQLEEQKKETADQQDRQRLEEMFKKILNSRPENSTPEVDKPKRRHSIAFGGNSYMSNMNRRVRLSEAEQPNWNALFRLDEEENMVTDSGRSSRMSTEMNIVATRPVTPEIDALNQQGVQTDGVWIEKSSYNELSTVSAEMKMQVEQLQQRLQTLSEEFELSAAVHQKSLADIDELKRQLEEQKSLTEAALSKEASLQKALLEKEEELRKNLVDKEEVVHKALLDKMNDDNEKTTQLDELGKKLKRAKENARLYKDKYDDLKEHGLKILKEKTDTIEKQKADFEEKREVFEKELEAQRSEVRIERARRMELEDVMKKACLELEQDLEKERLAKKTAQEGCIDWKTKTIVLEEKLEEMRVAPRGVKYVSTCTNTEHAVLVDKLDVLTRQKHLLVQKNYELRDRLSNDQPNFDQENV